jgi:hypothetical protein
LSFFVPLAPFVVKISFAFHATVNPTKIHSSQVCGGGIVSSLTLPSKEKNTATCVAVFLF